MSTLQARLSDPEYQNWVMAGICLLYTREGLENFVADTSRQLHQNVLDNLTRSSIPNTGQPVCGITITRQRLVTVCHHPYCQAFLNAVIQEGLDPNHPFTLRHGNLANSNISLWHSHPYELAKIFMNPGQTATQSGPAKTDLSGLVNFIAHCKISSSKISSRQLIEEVRNARNAIMHTSEFKMTEPDFKIYSQSMINLLSDVNISASPRAQHAVANIQRVTNAADFTITLEDEGKVMTSLTAELHTMTVEIKQKVAEVEKGVEEESSEIRRDIQHGEEEMRKVHSLYNTLQQRVDESCDLRDQMGNQLKKLEEQQKQTFQVVDHLQAQQKTYQTQTVQAIANFAQLQIQTHKEIGNLQAQQDTYQIETNESIENIKTEQEEYHRKTDEAIGDLRNKAGQTWIPSEEDKLRLRQYLIEGYKDKLDVTLLPDWEQLPVSEIFTPSILVCDHEEENQETETFESQGSYREMIHDQIASMSRPPLLHEAVKCKTNLGSYKEMFYKDGVLQKRVFLLGEAGSGKTTFSKHLTDVWCQTTTSPQFKDVAVFKQFQYFFYVSCRFADEMETILDMITNQLFDDDKLKEAAIYVLKHYPECCLIVLDGADEWKGSPTSETGRRRDIAGLPGMTGVENCVILITSRPWRFHALSTKSMKVFRCLTINGIKNVAKLAQRILRKLEDPVPVKSSDEFLCQVREKNMHELMKIPLILILALGGWVKNKALHNSMTINYINMIQSFIHRSKGHSGWSSSESKLRQLIPILDHLESEWRQKSNELPYIVSRYKPMQRYAGLFLSLGQLAFDQLLGKEEQSLVFSKAHFKSYLCGDDENDESLNVCLALGILSNTQTTTRNLKKLDSYTFCHKTFQEFFAALWLSSKYSREKSKLYKCLKNVDNLLGYNILIQFLCGIDPRVGKQFWLDLAEEVEIEEIKDDSKKRLQKLACKCMNEQGFDETDQASDQIYFYIPHIRIDNFISYGDFIPLKDVMLLCHVMEEYSCNIKSVYVDMHRSNQQEQALIVRSVSSCCGLQSLILQDQPNINNNISGSPVLDLQKHSLKIRGLFIECLLLPMEQLRITSLKLDNVIMTHHGFEQMGNSLSSCSGLEKLYLNKVSCSDNSCLPVLDLQKHNKLWLWNLSVECLLIHFEGVRFTSLDMFNVKMAHHGLEQLGGSLASCSGLEKLYLNRLICSEHGDRCFIPALDLQKHNKLETLKLLELSVEGLLLPLTDTRLTSLNMFNVKLAHSLEQLSGSLSSCISLNDLYLDKVACNNGDICCSLVLNLQNHNKMEGLTLCNLSVEGLVLPVEGAEITSLVLCRVTVAHRSLERLGESLMSCSGIENLILREVRCSQHRDDSCRPVQDLFNFQRLN